MSHVIYVKVCICEMCVHVRTLCRCVYAIYSKCVYMLVVCVYVCHTRICRIRMSHVPHKERVMSHVSIHHVPGSLAIGCSTQQSPAGWQRRIKCLIFILYSCIPEKEPYNSWLFGRKRPAIQGILFISATRYTHIYLVRIFHIRTSYMIHL